MCGAAGGRSEIKLGSQSVDPSRGGRRHGLAYALLASLPASRLAVASASVLKRAAPIHSREAEIGAPEPLALVLEHLVESGTKVRFDH
jgi:hypothetical protein